jgi:hypothetical protein
MANPVASATQVRPQAAAQAKPVIESATSSPKSIPLQQPAKSSTPADAVHISSAGQSAVQEAIETSAQTGREARGGDRQAQNLLAREAAARKTG